MFFNALVVDSPGVTVFPPELFYPSTDEEREQAFGVHHAARLWHDVEGLRHIVVARRDAARKDDCKGSRRRSGYANATRSGTSRRSRSWRRRSARSRNSSRSSGNTRGGSASCSSSGAFISTASSSPSCARCSSAATRCTSCCRPRSAACRRRRRASSTSSARATPSRTSSCRGATSPGFARGRPPARARLPALSGARVCARGPTARACTRAGTVADPDARRRSARPRPSRPPRARRRAPEARGCGSGTTGVQGAHRGPQARRRPRLTPRRHGLDRERVHPCRGGASRPDRPAGLQLGQPDEQGRPPRRAHDHDRLERGAGRGGGSAARTPTRAGRRRRCP